MSVGMPAYLKLQAFGSLVLDAFEKASDTNFCGVYQVGSSLTDKAWRDVDVRLLIDDDEYAALGLGNPRQPYSNGRWVAQVLAFAALGRDYTGLPIVAVRACTNELVLADGGVLECDGSVYWAYPAIAAAVPIRDGQPAPVDMREVAYRRVPA